MDKIDFKRDLKHLYQPPADQFTLIEVPAMQFLMLDGHGDPNSAPAYQEAVEALYAVAYKLKFASKQQVGRDYTVMPLEGLWWAEDMASFTARRDKSQWDWTMMILAPDWIEPGLVGEAIAQTGAKDAPRRLGDVRFAALAEGLCVQTLHVGSFDAEAEVLARLHDAFIPANGLRMTGKHHEIYLSDPRRTAPEKLRTILRQPVLPAS